MSHDNKDDQCFVGKLLDAGLTKEQIAVKVREWERQCLKTHGWFAHYVDGIELVPNGVNFHTHGFESKGHPDFQVVVNCPQRVVHSIFSNLYQKVEKGEKFEHGGQYYGIIIGFPVLMLMAYEDDRQLLRIILPDTQGNLEKSRMSSLRFQYDDLLLTEPVTESLCNALLEKLDFRLNLDSPNQQWSHRGTEGRANIQQLINLLKADCYVDKNVAAQLVNYYLRLIQEFEELKASFAK